MKNLIQGVVLLLALLGAQIAASANAWSTQDYDLYPGDFDGDGLADILFISKDPRYANGIALSTGNGFGTILQTWDRAYLGIAWSDGAYNIQVADFNGDRKADVLMQPKGKGDSFLLITETGGVLAIAQSIPAIANGLAWTGDAHRLVPGDYNGDGRADLFFQATDAQGVNAVLYSDVGGMFTSKAPVQTWQDGSLGFRWATTESNVYSGDFNGDGRADLLVQAIPERAAPGTLQPPIYVPNSYGVVLAAATEKPFGLAGVQAWNEDGFNAHWSPLASVVAVADTDGDGKADVVLQGATPSDQTYLLKGRAPGAIFANASVVKSDIVPNAQAYRLLAGAFAGGRASSLYLQAMSRDSDNLLGSLKGGRLSVSVASVQTSATDTTSALAPNGSAKSLASTAAAPIQTAALLAQTAAGRTAGQFAVSAMGAATYQIPIWTPPGARGIEPKLAVVYQSGGPDGLMGPGWSLSGMSSITRCEKTFAENGGVTAAVTLTLSDDFCLDGNRLRVTSGTYGASGSVYQTAIANFSRITANGTAGNGPSYFVVEGKDGLIYEYGNTADSKAYANASSTPYAWMLNKVRDRQPSPDNMIYTYATVSGAIRLTNIQYTQTPSTNGATYPYNVVLTYQNRVTNLSKYVAGSSILQTQLLSKIDVQSSGVSVRQTGFTYETAPTTTRDRLKYVQECGGSAGTDCLRQTTAAYQDGAAGAVSPATSTGSGATAAYSARTADFNGDGKDDLLFSTQSGSSLAYWVQFASGGNFTAPTSVGLTTSGNVLIEDFLGEGKWSLSGILWARHNMREDHGYAKQEENAGRAGGRARATAEDCA